nr:uncharacterized protein LOC112717564 [Arachis hypogaea]
MRKRKEIEVCVRKDGDDNDDDDDDDDDRGGESFIVYIGTSDGYVIGSEDEIARIDEHAASKILVLGLLDGSNGKFSVSISSCFWQWKSKFNVHYEKAGCENIGLPNIFFLPDFGVGSFHYEKQLKDLERDNKVPQYHLLQSSFAAMEKRSGMMGMKVEMHTVSFWSLKTNLSSNNLFSIHFTNRNGHITLHLSTSIIFVTVSSTNSTERFNCHEIYIMKNQNVFSILMNENIRILKSLGLIYSLPFFFIFLFLTK